MTIATASEAIPLCGSIGTATFDTVTVDAAAECVPTEDAPLARGGRLTLTQAYHSIHLPALKVDRSAKSTIDTYRCNVRHWERFGFATLDVREVRQSHLLMLKAAMIEAGYSPQTFYSAWRSIRAILMACVIEGLLDGLPRTPRIRQERCEPGERPAPEEFDRLMAACDAADWPRRFGGRRIAVAPPVIWRGLLATAYLTALRRGDLNRLSKSHMHADGVRIIASKTRKRKKLVFCPDVQGTLSAALAPLLDWHAERIFPLCLSRGFEIGRTHRVIADAAGVPIERATFHPLRRASLDAWTSVDERAAGLIGGHGLRGLLPTVTREHYVSPQAEQARSEQILREAAERFPLPASLRPTC